MAILRTQRLSAGSALTAGGKPSLVDPRYIDAAVYECPAGHRAVVKDVRISDPSGGVDAGHMVWVSVYPEYAARWVWWLAPAGASTYVKAGTGSVVLEAGDILLISSGNAVVNWYVSGALLPLPLTPD